MTGVRAEHNGAYGVQVTGASTDRPITGIGTTGNGGFGIGLDNQTGMHVTAVSTSADGSGGLELTRSRDVTISALTAADEPAGVFTHVNNANVVLDQLTVTGGRRGVVVEKTTDGLTMQASTIQGASVAGIADDGKDVALHGVAVRDSRTALRVERGADGVTASDLTISGGQDGVVAAAGTTRMVLQDLRADGLTGTGVRSASPDARILGGAITGGTTGIDLTAATSISGTSISLTDQGIRAESTGLVHADDVDVDAVSVGIDTGDAGPFLLTRSQVHALEAVRGTLTAEGTNDLSLPPLNLLGAIGIPLILSPREEIGPGQPRTGAGRASSSSNGPTTAVTCGCSSSSRASAATCSPVTAEIRSRLSPIVRWRPWSTSERPMRFIRDGVSSLPSTRPPRSDPRARASSAPVSPCSATSPSTPRTTVATSPRRSGPHPA